jgi:DNA-binding LacI/PurR family transcriptional regulator
VSQTSGYSLFMAAAQKDHDHEQGIVQDMVERRVDGIIICSTPVSTEQSRQLASFGVPIVMVNNPAAEEYRYSIYHDDTDGSRQITRYLIELGHRKIAYLGNANAGRSTLDRQSGFQKELELARITIPSGYIHLVPGGRPENGLSGVEHFLGLPTSPTAVVCYNDMMAIGVLQAFQSVGIQVPEQVSVTGFDNIIFSTYTNPPLTTFDQPKRFIGAEAARLVLGLLKGNEGSTNPKIQTLKGSLLVRGSTSRPGRVSPWTT